jgi:pimeloyl-ACP methyl ester carboxylesterase
MRSTSHESLAAPARIAASYPDPGWRRTDTVLPGDGLRIATFETGRRDAGAPVLLLVHGLGHWTQAAWDRLAPELAAEYRIVSLDLPGFGDSEKPDLQYRLPFFVDVLRRFIEARQLDDVLLAGHSLGGLIGADLARDSSRIRGLVLIDPAGFMRAPRIMLRVIASRPAGWLFKIRPSAGFVRRTLDQAMFDPANVSAEVHARAYALALDPDVRRAFARIYSGALQEMLDLKGLHARLARYRGPVLLAWGRHDAYVPIAALRNARAVYPQAHAVIFERSGHCPNVEEPQGLAAQILLMGTRAASSDGRWSRAM